MSVSILQVQRKHNEENFRGGGKVSKPVHQNWVDALTFRNKGSCCEQEKLLALVGEDV